jgi:glycosyltransferase involved in cell wall biosynthesis
VIAPAAAASTVRAVIGVPLYNGVSRGHFQDAVGSLLAQTYGSVAFVFVDDQSTDETARELNRITQHDDRVIFEQNETRLGLVDNWRRVFRIARSRFPGAPYFAWGSDHDRWEPSWLERLVAELDAHPRAVLGFTRYTRLDDRDGQILESRGVRATVGLERADRFAYACSKIGAGKLVYGLFRSEALERVGVYPRVHQPDVYIMMELSLYGETCFVNETLWHFRQRAKRDPGVKQAKAAAKAAAGRRTGGWEATLAGYLGRRSITKQHRRIFPAGVPLYARLPAWLQHLGLLSWRLIVSGRGRPDVGRRDGFRYARQFVLSRLFAEDDPKRARLLRRPATKKRQV